MVAARGSWLNCHPASRHDMTYRSRRRRLHERNTTGQIDDELAAPRADMPTRKSHPPCCWPNGNLILSGTFAHCAGVRIPSTALIAP